MAVFQKKDKKRIAIEKELAILKKKENHLAQSALKAAPLTRSTTTRLCAMCG